MRSQRICRVIGTVLLGMTFFPFSAAALGELGQLPERLVGERRPASPAEEHGEVREQQRRDDAGRRDLPATAEPQLDRLGADLPRRPREREAVEQEVGVDPVPGRVRRRQEDDRAGGMALGEAGERVEGLSLPLGRHPREVRQHARPHQPAGVGLCTQLREPPLQLADGHVRPGPPRQLHRGRGAGPPDGPAWTLWLRAAKSSYVPTSWPRLASTFSISSRNESANFSTPSRSSVSVTSS